MDYIKILIYVIVYIFMNDLSDGIVQPKAAHFKFGHIKMQMSLEAQKKSGIDGKQQK